MEQIKGRLYLAGAFTLAGTSVIAARFLAGRAGTFTIASVSLFFAVAALLPVSGRKLWDTIRGMSLRGWVMAALQALFGIFLFRMFLLMGLRLTGAGEAGVLTGATPAATVLLACFVLKEKMNKNSAAGICCTVLGIAVLHGIFAPGSSFLPEHIPGNLLVLCAAVCESVFNILSRVSILSKDSGNAQPQDPIVRTAIVCMIALLFCILPAASENPVTALTRLGLFEWLALLWYGLFVTALAFIFWYSGIKRCTACTAAAFSGMMPFASLVLSVLILGETAGFSQWCGGLLVIAGMVLIGRTDQAGGKKRAVRPYHISPVPWGKLRKKQRGF